MSFETFKEFTYLFDSSKQWKRHSQTGRNKAFNLSNCFRSDSYSPQYGGITRSRQAGREKSRSIQKCSDISFSLSVMPLLTIDKVEKVRRQQQG